MRVSGPSDVQELILKWRKRFWLATVVIVLVMVDVALWKQGPPAFLTNVAHYLIKPKIEVIATSASFSVSAGTFPTVGRASAFAAALDASGLPVLVRQRPEDSRYQVLVGPYVSTEEAEAAQRALGAWGLGEPRLVVDDTMRGGPQPVGLVDSRRAVGNGVLIIAAPGMTSIVFEMPSVPREVEARRGSTTTIDVEIGNAEASGAATVLGLPEGIVLARAVALEPTARPDSRRARLVVPAEVQSRLRLEGRRVYVDLAWPKAPWQLGDRPAVLPRDLRVASRAEPPQSLEDKRAAYEQQFQAAIDRFEQIQPFLISATESPDANVLAALSHTLDGLRDTLAGMNPPTELAENRQQLAEAVAMAADATMPAFSGDRQATARHALELFDEARK